MAEKCLMDRDEIRAWIEERGGTPTIVQGVSEKDGNEDPEMLHITFGPGSSDVVHIGWAEFFDRLESMNLALVYDDERGKNDFTFVGRAEAVKKFFPESDLPDTGERELVKENEHPSGRSADEEGV